MATAKLSDLHIAGPAATKATAQCHDCTWNFKPRGREAAKYTPADVAQKARAHAFHKPTHKVELTETVVTAFAYAPTE